MTKLNFICVKKERRFYLDADFHETCNLSRVQWQISYKEFHPHSTKNGDFLVVSPFRPQVKHDAHYTEFNETSFHEVFLWNTLYGKLLTEFGSMKFTGEHSFTLFSPSLTTPFFKKPTIFLQNSVKISYTENSDNTINSLSKLLSRGEEEACGLRFGLYLHKMGK